MSHVLDLTPYIERVKAQDAARKEWQDNQPQYFVSAANNEPCLEIETHHGTCYISQRKFDAAYDDFMQTIKEQEGGINAMPVTDLAIMCFLGGIAASKFKEV
jgi:hypothetical protein